MANADDLRRLAEEMAVAYEMRVNGINVIKKEAVDLLNTFGESREEMADNLRAELARFKSDLDASEDERKKTDQAEVSQRSIDIENLLSDFDTAHQEMANNLRAELARFKTDLDASEDERKKTDQAEVEQRSVDIDNLLSDFDTAHQEMADNLRAELARFKTDLDASEDQRKKRDQAEVGEMAEAWRNLLSAMQAARGRTVVAGPVEVEAKVEVKTVEEVIEEPAEEVEEVEEAAAEVEEEEEIEEVAAEEEAIEEVAAEEEEIEEDLGGRILDLLEDRSEGLKMTQIADMLGIESWRALIPVIRGLIDDEEIRKEGTLYFPSE